MAEGVLHADLEAYTQHHSSAVGRAVCHLDLQVRRFLKPVLSSAGYLLIQAWAECSCSYVCDLESSFSKEYCRSALKSQTKNTASCLHTMYKESYYLLLY